MQWLDIFVGLLINFYKKGLIDAKVCNTPLDERNI